METIYLSHSAQVAMGTFFMKSPVGDFHQVRTEIDVKGLMGYNLLLLLSTKYCSNDFSGCYLQGVGDLLPETL